MRVWVYGLMFLSGVANAQSTSTLQALEREFAHYPPAKPWVPIGDGLSAQGRDMQAATFETSDAPERVKAFYWHAFETEGLFRSSPASGAGLAISGIDSERHLQKLVVMEPFGTGTRVTLVLSPLSSTEPAVQPEALPIDLPASCAEVRWSSARDGDNVSEVAVVRCKGPVEAVTTGAREGLLKAGFRAAGENGFARGTERWDLRALKEGQGTSLVFVRQRRAAPAH